MVDVFMWLCHTKIFSRVAFLLGEFEMRIVVLLSEGV